ncbi:hypothetical protein [Marinobacter sp. DS40M6]|uniref:hypothetical protein n=1 Tax=Marinobacter sp. DS40M6 TaxID=1597776 RepID=UPI002359F252|nr:hypothetical protein [Marinobacter sp. DS40M6]MDC8457816.1 hypothetical protein [Marinobacter sp. DS40M6]
MAHGEPPVITIDSPFPVASVNHIGIENTGIKTIDDQGEGGNTFTDVQVYSFSFNGHRARSYFDDLYFKVHFTPGQINLGNVLSVQTEEIRVWNAHLSSKDITSYLEPSEEGVSVQAPVSAPYTMPPLEELSYTVTVSTDGPPQFNTEILWVIDGVNYSVPITGQRVVVWPFGPNWDQPMYESLEWKTDVITAFNGAEERRPLRTKARRRINYRLSLWDNELVQFQNLLFGWQDRQYAVPVWFDKTVLMDAVSEEDTYIPVDTTTRSFFEGGLAILMKDSYTFEVFEIDEVNTDHLIAKNGLENSWGALTRLYPLNLAALPNAVQTQRLTSRVMTGSVDFQMFPVGSDPFIPGEPAVETLDGKEVIYKKPNWSSPVQYSHESDFEMLDYQIGAIQQVGKPSFPRQVRRMQWLLRDRSEIKDFRALLGRFKGRFRSAYFPSWFKDFELAEPSGLGAVAVKVKMSQYDSLVGASDTQNAILVRMRDGRKFIRKITGTSVFSGEVEQLNLDNTLPYEVTPTNVLMISLVHLCRLSQDGVTINYQSDSVATVEISAQVVRE